MLCLTVDCAFLVVDRVAERENVSFVNLAFMSGINCMGTMPGYDRVKRMPKQLKIIKEGTGDRLGQKM